MSILTEFKTWLEKQQVLPKGYLGKAITYTLNQWPKLLTYLEDGDISLEDSVKSFEEGIGLVKDCQKQLSEAELKVKKLLDNGDSIDLEN